jgi:antitoxin component of RelBE/YafQ-DinJ toxin-antitoxin module
MNNTPVLERYARRKRGETKVTSIRIQANTYNEFQLYCERLGLSLSEGIELLIGEELKKVATQDIDVVESITDVAKNNTTVTKRNTSVVKKNTNVTRKDTNVSEVNTSATQKKKRFHLEPYKRESDKLIPCPICETWIDNTNYSAHAKRHHKMKSGELITENIDKVTEMLEKEK